MLLLGGAEGGGHQLILVHALQTGLLLAGREVEGRDGTVNHVVALGGGIADGVGSPGAPPGQRGGLRETSLYYLVPAQHLAAFLVDVGFHLVDEPRLELLLVFQLLLLDAALAVGTFLPVYFLHFVTAYVYIVEREEGYHLVPDVAAEL